jgi:hypothetical protein
MESLTSSFDEAKSRTGIGLKKKYGMPDFRFGVLPRLKAEITHLGRLRNTAALVMNEGLV